MTRQAATQAPKQPSTTHPLSSGLLQRKCESCGQHRVGGGKCGTCQKQESFLQNDNQQETQIQRKSDPISAQSGFNHEFSQVPISTTIPRIQPKLRVSQPNDKYEQEADRIADQIMRMPEPNVQRQIGMKEEDTLQSKPVASQITPLIQRQVEEGDEEKTIQTKRASSSVLPVTQSIQAGIHNLRQSGGQPLPPATRAFMEPRFRHDFSGVRIHTGSDIINLTNSLDARAFTVKQDIFLNRSDFQPNSNWGRWLFAHELTHTIQQQREATDKIQRLSPANNNRGISFENPPTIEEYSQSLQKFTEFTGVTLRECNGKAFFDRKSSCAWNKVLGQAPTKKLRVKEGKVGSRRGSAKGQTVPTIQQLPPANDERTQIPLLFLNSLVKEVEERLNTVPIPRTEGELLLTDSFQYQFQTKSNLGRGREPASSAEKTNRAFKQFTDEINNIVELAADFRPEERANRQIGLKELEKLVGRELDEFDKSITKIFFLVQGEGDLASINISSKPTRITLASGFMGVNAFKFLLNLPSEVHDEFFRYGIHINEDNTFLVLDTIRGVVEGGDNALKIIATDQRRISVFINLMQKPVKTTSGEETRLPAFQAQWETFKQFQLGQKSKFPDRLNDWTDPQLRFATKLNFRKPSIATWALLERAGDAEGIKGIAQELIKSGKMPKNEVCEVAARTKVISALKGICDR